MKMIFPAPHTHLRESSFNSTYLKAIVNKFELREQWKEAQSF